MCYFDDIDSTDLTRFGRERVEIADDLFFIRYRDIQSFQFWIGVKYLGQFLYRRNFEVFISCVNVLVLELLIEITDGEGVSKRVAYQSVFVHCAAGVTCLT